MVQYKYHCVLCRADYYTDEPMNRCTNCFCPILIQTKKDGYNILNEERV